MNANDDVRKSKRFWINFACYSLALLLTLFIIFALYNLINVFVGQAITDKLKALEDQSLHKMIISIGTIGFLYLLVHGTTVQGNLWRSREHDINLFGLNSIPNYFYDKSFDKNGHHLKKKIKELSNQLEKANALLKRSDMQRNKLESNIKDLRSNLSVFIRHHQNTSRIMGSMSFLLEENSGKKVYVDEMLKNVLSESVTVLTKDQSDKSVALFEIKEDQKLHIREYFRIGARSARSRRFKKGEGFAGSIWEKGFAEMVQDVSQDKRFNKKQNGRYSFLSIMGMPIKVGDTIIGVLCIQSENIEGFSEDDLLAIEFYVNVCATLLLYDKIYLLTKEGD
ncbi:GAF domain-containing protein [Bacillus suaedae]|uniref:GAF domain-containing protein n=1 Tax=Halalkalibacter suaedae TaxID=2822140 RepID=A0A940WUP2_9BACI|nr:GAF domain-containing protein [Bacillus suaedae]MBP3953089.1 GAF domain-containing protein [Bacillus suaedae]